MKLMESLPASITNNISAIIMALIFIWYLTKRDIQVQETFNNFAEKLERLSDALKNLQLQFEQQREK